MAKEGEESTVLSEVVSGDGEDCGPSLSEMEPAPKKRKGKIILCWAISEHAVKSCKIAFN